MLQLIGIGNRIQEKIFGVVNLKIGATSLGSASEIFGYKHTLERRRELFGSVWEKRLHAIYRRVNQYDNVEDWPYPIIFRQLDLQYPKSREEKVDHDS